ncbi:MAG TPA: acetate/propionate family kinase, partial [Planctomycetaceae bacterium]|nr:acetate/propionate family kinase [Planctomycetaceae bacterium]
LDEVLDHLANKSGLLGLSGISGDIRDLHAKAAEGHDGAKYALEVFVADVRRGIGAMMMALGGVDVIAFTGGIGENDDVIRREVCRNLDQLGIQLCENANLDGDIERRIDADSSQVQLWIVPTNEEIIVARQTVSCVTEGS